MYVIKVKASDQSITVKYVQRTISVTRAGRGPTGPSGADGPVGPTGATGAQGPQGDPGLDGLVTTVEAGTNISVDDSDPAHPIVSSTAASDWGDIGGTLSNQTDLQTALDGKVPTTRTVNGHALSSNVTVSKSDVGLGNVDNTSDANKPVSTAQATADALVASNAATALSTHESDTTNVHGITNTASLETTSGAQAKADAKVADAINNGTTTVAPSQNAVYDALALKANSVDIPGTIVESVVAGSNVTVDNTDPANPVVSSSGGGGGGLSDGDFGDITVSGSGTVMTVDNDVVTNAKSANMAQSTIKGRAAAAGTGDPTDLTAAQVRTIINVADGATANDTDANLKNRANHTGTQLLATISDVTASAAEVNLLDGVTASTTELNYTDGVTSAIQTQLDGKVDENAGITGATKTKVTYDAKGLVTAGADATTADIADSSNKRYVTDAQLTVIGNTSGTNTGDQVLPVKATGAEIDTGTDDAKFATAKAIEDSSYIKAAYADALVVDSIADSDTTHAPSRNAVFDALALKQPLDSDLTTIAGLTPTTDNFMVATAGAWASRTPSQARTQMGLGALATLSTVGTTQIDDAAVTLAKMANLAQDQFIGRTTASTGVPETATITSAARTVLDDTTVGAMVDTLGGASSTGTGGLVRKTSAALVTPDLGTPSALTLTNATGLPVAGITASTSTALGVGSLEIGHASDTTLSRASAGRTAVEGINVVLVSSTDTLTNKRITKRTSNEASSATPTINTDNVDMHLVTALATNITSMTTNLSGTPTEGQTLWIAITGTATRTIAWGASFEAGANALPTTTVGTNRLDVGFVWNTVTTKWRCVAVG